MPAEQGTGHPGTSELPLPPNTRREIWIKLPNGKEISGSRASLVNALIGTSCQNPAPRGELLVAQFSSDDLDFLRYLKGDIARTRVLIRPFGYDVRNTIRLGESAWGCKEPEYYLTHPPEGGQRLQRLIEYHDRDGNIVRTDWEEIPLPNGKFQQNQEADPTPAIASDSSGAMDIVVGEYYIAFTEPQVTEVPAVEEVHEPAVPVFESFDAVAAKNGNEPEAPGGFTYAETVEKGGEVYSRSAGDGDKAKETATTSNAQEASTRGTREAKQVAERKNRTYQEVSGDGVKSVKHPKRVEAKKSDGEVSYEDVVMVVSLIFQNAILLSGYGIDLPTEHMCRRLFAAEKARGIVRSKRPEEIKRFTGLVRMLRAIQDAKYAQTCADQHIAVREIFDYIDRLRSDHPDATEALLKSAMAKANLVLSDK